jgi:hypothetical protein
MRTLFLCLILCVQSAWARPSLVLKAHMAKGQVDVFLNDRPLGRFGSEDVLHPQGPVTREVTALSRPGQNQLRCKWQGKRAPVGEVHLSYSEDGVKYRELAAMDFGVMSRNSGDQKAAFLMPAAASRAQPGSQLRQTLLTCNLTRGKVTVLVNGRKVGSYVAGLVPLDISNHVHSGANTLAVKWDDKSRIPLGSIRISYAERKNQFRKIAEHDLSVFTQRRSGPDQSVTFQLP